MLVPHIHTRVLQTFRPLNFFYLSLNFVDTFSKNPQISNVMEIHAVGVDGNDEANSRFANARNELDLCSTALHGFHVCIRNVFNFLRIYTRQLTMNHACHNNQHVATANSKALFLC